MMRCLRLPLASIVIAATYCVGAAVPSPSPDESTARPWTRWWWPGSAVDEANITRELEAFAAVGLGGVEITPIYGARGYEDRYVTFLSPRWMELLAHTAREAQRLGLSVDMATGTGWPFGGPWIQPEHGSAKLVLRDGRLAGAPTGMQVKRAAPGGEGLVIDPYSLAALKAYLAPFTTAFADFPHGLVRAQFHDSFEYYDSGWTDTLLETFRTMHGYDLQDFASALFARTESESGASGSPSDTNSGAAAETLPDEDTIRRVKGDYRATLARLHLDYVSAWAAWAHQQGFIVRNQSHGAPANLLDVYGAVDIPETETFGSTPFPIPGLRRDPRDIRGDRDLPESLVIRLASSAAHVMGRPLASSETCTWLREHWKVALSFTKPEIDRLFADGINHIIYHGTCYSPNDAPWPGWLFYASTQFNDRNPWWQDFPALNAYVTRVQAVLQSGTPDNDVLLYWPFHDVIDDPDGLMQQYGVHEVDWLTASPAGQLASRLTREGYAWDYISDAQLLGTRRDGTVLVTPGGTRYRALIVPATRRMPVETLAQLHALQRDGGPVIFLAPPEDVPGRGRLDERRARFRELRDAIGAQGGFSGELVGRLRASGVTREPLAEHGLRFIRRTTADGHAYFIVNLGPDVVSGWFPVGRPAQGGRFVDPLSGAEGLAPSRSRADGDLEFFLRLEPGESRILHTFTDARSPDSGPAWPVFEPGSAHELKGRWRVRFIAGGPERPGSFATRELRSWTELGGTEAQRFAGTARYRLEFSLPRDVAADDWLLDLGDVRESARVRVNGTEVATLWSLPFRVRLGAHLRPGNNVLEIDVTNLAANRIRDLDRRGVTWRIMREINFVNIRYRPFDASDWELTPSGLLGPVKLVPLQRLEPSEL